MTGERAAGACFDNEADRNRSRAIGAYDFHAARERLIPSRRAHLDQLARKLEEEWLRRVVSSPSRAAGRCGRHQDSASRSYRPGNAGSGRFRHDVPISPEQGGTTILMSKIIPGSERTTTQTTG